MSEHPQASEPYRQNGITHGLGARVDAVTSSGGGCRTVITCWPRARLSAGMYVMIPLIRKHCMEADEPHPICPRDEMNDE